MNVNFGFLNHTIMFVYRVDLADLVTLIDWNQDVELSEIKELAIGVSLAQGSFAGDDLHKTATLIEYSRGIRIDYVGAHGRNKPPMKKNANMVFGASYEVTSDEVVRRIGVIDTKAGTFSDLDPINGTKRVSSKDKLLEEIGKGDYVRTENTEAIGVKKGVYHQGRRVK